MCVCVCASSSILHLILFIQKVYNSDFKLTLIWWKLWKRNQEGGNKKLFLFSIIIFISIHFTFFSLIASKQLGVVFLELNKPAQALAYLDKALEYNPEHEQALLNSAILLQELARPELRKIARERLMKLLEKDGKYSKLLCSSISDMKIYTRE